MEHLEFVAALWNVEPACPRPRPGILERLSLGTAATNGSNLLARHEAKRRPSPARSSPSRGSSLLETAHRLDASAARLVKDILPRISSRRRLGHPHHHILEVAERLAERIGS